MNSLKRLFSYVKPYWWQSVIGILTMLAVSGSQLVYPVILGKGFFDQVLDAKSNQFKSLNLLILVIILLIVFKAVFTFLQSYLMSFVGQRVVTDLRNEIFQHLQKLSISYHETHRVGETMSRTTNDIGMIQNSISRVIIDVIYQCIMLIGTLVAIFVMQWRLALLTLVTFPLVFIIVSLAGNKIRQISHTIQERISDISSILQENLTGIRVIKAFTTEDFETRRFQEQTELGFQTSMKSTFVMSLLTPIVETVFIVGLILVIWYGGHEVLSGAMTKGDLITFFGYVALAMTPITNITGNLNTIQQSIASAERVFEVLDHEIEVKDDPQAIDMPKIHGDVIFQAVNFGYNADQKVLTDINLNVPAGKVVALVGPSGAGKTSLASLILRFYDPLSGRILIDGYDIKKVKAETFRKQIALVPQESVLFRMSVRENIAYGCQGATLQKIEEAAKAANAHEFIMGLSQGYDTLIGERGTSLSGGQRQRIAIARAILRNPRILILDEATSALDNESEKLIQEALERLMVGRTTFIIAHRLSTIQHADKIVVLAEGSIVEEGTHAELLSRKGLYHKLYELGTEILK